MSTIEGRFTITTEPTGQRSIELHDIDADRWCTHGEDPDPTGELGRMFDFMIDRLSPGAAERLHAGALPSSSG